MPCEHNWINVFDFADLDAQIRYGFESTDIIFVGKKCVLCEKFEKRDKMKTPWNICFNCGFEMMEKVSEDPEIWTCRNCNRTWPLNSQKTFELFVLRSRL